jgi:hypothetical protein
MRGVFFVPIPEIKQEYNIPVEMMLSMESTVI